MKSKAILSHLTDLESLLHNFSFEELNSEDASRLKKTFNSFKSSLEDKVVALSHPNLTKNKEDFQKKIVPEYTPMVLPKKETPLTNHSLLLEGFSKGIINPLNQLLELAGSIKEGELNNLQRQQIQAIQSISNNLLDTSSGLWEYTRISSGVEQFKTINFNLKRLLKDVVYLQNTLLPDKQIKVRSMMDEALPEILIGDPSKLAQVLLNLLAGVVKNVKSGNILLTVSNKLQVANHYWLDFTLTYDGVRVSKKSLKSKSAAKPGNGLDYNNDLLNLNITKIIIKTLKGCITTSSNMDKGFAYILTLPYKKFEKNTQDGVTTKIVNKNMKKPENLESNKEYTTATGLQISLQPMLKECFGDVEVLLELVRLFKQNVLEFIGRTKLCLQTMDYMGIEQASHKIKYALAMMKVDELHSIALQMNQTAKTQKDIEHIASLYTSFLEEYTMVNKAMDRELNKILKQ